MKPAIEVSAWQAMDGSLFSDKESAEQRNERLEFRRRYEDHQLFDPGMEVCLPADNVFHWLKTFPDLYWTFTIPPTEETTNEG